MTIELETLVQAIRFDVDYHCLENRRTTPIQGSINRELYNRLNRAETKGVPMFPSQMRLRILNSMGAKANQDNHAQFDKAIEAFKERLSTFHESNYVDYSGTAVVIED